MIVLDGNPAEGLCLLLRRPVGARSGFWEDTRVGVRGFCVGGRLAGDASRVGGSGTTGRGVPAPEEAEPAEVCR